MLRILNAIACWAHWVYGIPEIMLQFVKIQLAGTNPQLSKIKQCVLGREFQRQIFQGGGADFQ